MLVRQVVNRDALQKPRVATFERGFARFARHPNPNPTFFTRNRPDSSWKVGLDAGEVQVTNCASGVGAVSLRMQL